MSEQTLLKDGFDHGTIERIARTFKRAYPRFDSEQFVGAASDGLTGMELKERARHVIGVLHNTLPADFSAAAEILHRTPDTYDPGDPDDPLRGFAAWPIIDYVGEYGLDDPGIAVPLLRRLTPMFSAEFAIRPFLRDHEKFVVDRLEEWTADPDPHVRRLVSEGTRPRLPWGMRLSAFVDDPSPILPLLTALRDDPSEMVRRSVANNLNDISKDHPDLVITICQEWLDEATDERRKLVLHAVRTLIKAGHPGVFGLLGFTTEPKLKTGDLRVTKNRLALGETLEFEIELVSLSTAQRFVVDYAIHFMKANGKTAPKVFKLRNVEAEADERVRLRKRHAIVPATTRRYYSGEHILAVHVNGQEIVRTTFCLDTNV